MFVLLYPLAQPYKNTSLHDSQKYGLGLVGVTLPATSSYSKPKVNWLLHATLHFKKYFRSGRAGELTRRHTPCLSETSARLHGANVESLV